MNWQVLGPGVIAAVIGLALWAYRKLPRVQAAAFAFAAVCAALGVTAWLDALARRTAGVAGLFILAAVTALAALAFWFEVVRKHKHHRIRTPVFSAVFGTALVMTLASLRRMEDAAVRTPGRTITALSRAVSRVQSGRAAHAVTSSHSDVVLAIGAAAIVALVMVARRFEKPRGRGPAPALPPSASPPSRSPVPVGRGGFPGRKGR